MYDLRSHLADFLSARGRIFFLVWEHFYHLYFDNAKVQIIFVTTKYYVISLKRVNCFVIVQLAFLGAHSAQSTVYLGEGSRFEN
jgi:hypothetical protein